MLLPPDLNEKCEAIVIFGVANRNYYETVLIFNDRFPESPIDRHYFTDLVDKFFETVSVQNKKWSGRWLPTSKKKQVQIMDEFVVLIK